MNAEPGPASDTRSPGEDGQTSEKKIELRTLTPLWTGGFSGQMDRVHETALIGSLRWWYEALVRGEDGIVCDPTGEERCGFKPKLFAEAVGTPRERRRAAKLCDVCQLFGATGWRRRFRLLVEDSKLTVELQPCPPTPGRQDQCCLPPGGKDRCWAIKRGRIGDFDLHLLGETKDIAIVSALLAWVVPVAGIGARAQLGYGAVDFRTNAPDVKPLQDDLKQIADLPEKGTPAPTFPSRDRMFGAELTLQDVRYPAHPILELLHTKWDMRDRFRLPHVTTDAGIPMNAEDAKVFRHRILGANKPEIQGSKVSISRPFHYPEGGEDWTMRIWGWAPPDDKAEVVRLLNAYIKSLGLNQTVEPLELEI